MTKAEMTREIERIDTLQIALEREEATLATHLSRVQQTLDHLRRTRRELMTGKRPDLQGAA